MPDLYNSLRDVFTKNRAEELGLDVWEHFVVPPFYDRLDLPTARKPRVIVGGRGCGKTMLLRYLSHQSMFSAGRTTVPDSAGDHIGLYWRADTQFLSAMDQRGIPQDTWHGVFGHMAALELAREVLSSLQSIASSVSELVAPDDLTRLDFSRLCAFDQSLPSHYLELRDAIEDKLWQLEAWVNNARRLQEPTLLPGSAFVYFAAQVLRRGGRLLSVVPCSVVSGRVGRVIREYLISTGSILRVHELMKYTFSGLEARVFLLVYEKGARKRTTVLCNHDLAHPESLLISQDRLAADFRLDFGFYAAQAWHERIMRAWPELGWRRLDDVAKVYRGAMPSPTGARVALHTCDFDSGIWRCEPRVGKPAQDASERGIRSGDMLIKRVGRDCAKSIGLCADPAGTACSDCILLLRPNVGESVVSVMFALRTLVAWTLGQRLIEDGGTGARYVRADILSRLLIPTKLDMILPELSFRYAQVSKSDAHGRREIEDGARLALADRLMP